MPAANDQPTVRRSVPQTPRCLVDQPFSGRLLLCISVGSISVLLSQPFSDTAMNPMSLFKIPLNP